MAYQTTSSGDIKPIVKKGNNGANKGLKYSRVSVDNDMGRSIGELLMDVIRALGVPEFGSRYSNHVYSFRQKLAILIFMSFRQMSYNSLRKDLGMYGGFIRSIGLEHVPCGSTLCKFMACVDKTLLEDVVRAFAYAVECETVIVDTTGLSNFNRSAHYEKRCDEFGAKLVRTFTKLSLAVDRHTRMIISARAANGNTADIKFMCWHIQDMKESEVRPTLVVADKGYDSDDLHRMIRNRLGAFSVIPVRQSRGNRCYTVHGMYRNDMLDLQKDGVMWKSLYGQRSVIESTNFMLKALTGSHLSERKGGSREKRALLNVIAYNVLRTLDLVLGEKLIGGFQ